MTVLVADDDAVSRALLTEALSQKGLAALAVADGREAWEVIRSRPDIRAAIVNWLMPGMDGYEIFRRIRRIPLRGVGLALLAPRHFLCGVVRQLCPDADVYIAKPFRPDELADAVADIAAMVAPAPGAVVTGQRPGA